jgi:hypothetical protein
MRSFACSALACSSLALLSLASSARADEAAIAYSAPPTPHRVEARIGMLVGTGDVGDVSGPSNGVQLAIGARWGDVTGLAEYDYVTENDPDDAMTPRHGDLSRAGLVARWSLFHSGSADSPVAVDYWVEGGGGYERVTWAPGGVLDRPDLVLGFGAELDGQVNHDSGHPRHIGSWVGLRAIVARAPESGLPSVCGGPCSMATPPSRNDVGFYFTWGMHWGR